MQELHWVERVCDYSDGSVSRDYDTLVEPPVGFTIASPRRRTGYMFDRVCVSDIGTVVLTGDDREMFLTDDDVRALSQLLSAALDKLDRTSIDRTETA
ncbi:hypothetical protein ABQE93_20905 [Mycolicibacterium sp. XJ662]